VDGCTFSSVINEDRRRFESWVKLESSKVGEDLGVFPSVCVDVDNGASGFGNMELDLQEEDENKGRYWKDICPEMAIAWRKGKGGILRSSDILETERITENRSSHWRGQERSRIYSARKQGRRTEHADWGKGL